MISFFSFSGMDCDSQGIELRIIATKPAGVSESTDGFTGYYVINGGEEEVFLSVRDDKDGLYKFRRDLGIFRFVEITATKGDSRITMDVYLYDQNGNIIQKLNNSSCSVGNWAGSTATCTVSSTMSYTFRPR